MEVKIIEKIIAKREFRSNEGSIIEVIIGMPEKSPKGTGYVCLTQIKGLGSEKIRATEGEDSVQALFLALQRIGSILTTSEEVLKKKFTWLGSTAIDTFGFPLPNSIADLKR